MVWEIDRWTCESSSSKALTRLDLPAPLGAATILAIDAFTGAAVELHVVGAPSIEALALAHLALVRSFADQPDEALRIAGGPGFLAGRMERAFRDARAGLINPPLEEWFAFVIRREHRHITEALVYMEYEPLLYGKRDRGYDNPDFIVYGDVTPL